MDSSKDLFILIAGANASGKTTVIKPRYVEGRVKHYLDPDRLLPVADVDILSPKAREMYVQNRPDRFAVRCMKDWLASPRIRSEGIATESNLVAYHDFNILKTAKTAGMKTELYFVGLPLETALLRESIRSKNDEQEKINMEDIIQRYQKGLPNIQKHIASGNVDVVMVYDNSRSRGEEQLLLHIGNGKFIKTAYFGGLDNVYIGNVMGAHCIKL